MLCCLIIYDRQRVELRDIYIVSGSSVFCDVLKQYVILSDHLSAVGRGLFRVIMGDSMFCDHVQQYVVLSHTLRCVGLIQGKA